MVKAVVAQGPDTAPRVTDIEPAELGERDVRVRIAAAGVCHSDLSMVNGTLSPQFPLVLGHEASGTVVETGTATHRFAVGDRVVINWAAACRSCWFCRQGEPWLCSAAEGVVSPPAGRMSDGDPLHACMGIGAFAEEVVLPEGSLVPLPEGVPLDVGALMGCSVLTGVGAVRNSARVRAGESVLVVGLGGIGLSAVLGARQAGAGPIIAVDLAADKEPVAMAAGADHFLGYDAKLAKRVRALTGGRGADHAFECVGKAATIRTAWQAARRGGRCTVVGVGAADDEVTFSALELFHFARNLDSSVYGACDPERDIPMLAEQVRLGRLDLETLITHRIGIDGVEEAFERMRSGRGVRSVIEFAQ